MEAVVAVYSDWGIGCCGTQPVVVSADRKHFRAVTGTGAVIVGRKTLADFPGGKPLKNRVNIVVTRQNIEIENAVVAHSVEEAAEIAAQYDKAYVIGGASIYKKMLRQGKNLDQIYDLFAVRIIVETIKDCQPEMAPSFWLLFSVEARIISGKRRTGKPLVRMVK